MNHKLFLLLLLPLVCSPALARHKTDIIELLNGDRITAEIKRLEYGKLFVNTDAMGNIQIEWEDIAKVSSDYEFEFELTTGERFYGTLEPGADTAVLVITTATDAALLSSQQIVRITPIEDTFWERFEGSLSVGYSFTKASGVSQFSFSGTTTYRTPKRATSLNLSSIVTEDQANVVTEREDLNTKVTHFWGNRWFNTWLAGVERNDELGLNSRLSAGGAIGRHLIQNSKSELSILGGAIVTREDLVDDMPTKEHVEGLLGLGYRRYIFGDPNVDISAQLQVYPSFTESGRTRGQLDARIRYEVINDLFLDLTFYDSYDSDASLDSNNDYGIVTSVGWSF